MKIKIYCRKCKAESLLVAKGVLTLDEAKETVGNISEIVKRHESHPHHLEFYVFEDNNHKEVKQYIYEALNNRIRKHALK